MTNRRDILHLIKLVRRIPGWCAELRPGGHYRVRGPAGGLYFMPATPSDHRAVRNARAQLRRLGADI